MTAPERTLEAGTTVPARGRRAALLVLILLAAIFVKTGVWDTWRKESIDLPSFYLGAQLACSEHVSPYDRAAWDRAARAFPQHDVFPFLYPPASLVLFAPLSHMSYATAKALTLALNLAFLVLFLGIFLAGLMGLSWSDPLVVLAAVYSFVAAPVRLTLEHGQTNLAVLALLAAAWLGLKRGRAGLAVALPLSLAILLKLHVALALVYLVLKRRFRAAALTCALLLGSSIASLVLAPPSAWVDWVRDVLPGAGYGLTPPGLFSPAAPWNQSLNGFSARLFTTTEFAEGLIQSRIAARIVPYLLGIAVLMLCFRRWRPPGAGGANPARVASDLAPHELAHLLAAMVLVAPFSWEHHLVFLVPAALVVAADLSRLPRPDALSVLAGLAAIVIALPFRLASAALVPAPFSLLISVKLYAVVALWLYLTRFLGRAKGASAVAAPA